ncbi:MAG: penicillin acylase family protein [Nannocystaceae bacterium]
MTTPTRALAAITLLALTTCSGRGEGDTDDTKYQYNATIRRTTHGVPHIVADDLPSAAFGQAYAFAEDHACILADQILKVRSERAKFLGSGEGDKHLRSDLGYLALGIYDDAQAMLDAQSDELRAVIDAYVAGYNRYLEDTGIAKVPGYCRGAEWVRPIDARDLAAYYLSLGLVGSGVQFVDYITTARPPGAPDQVPGPPISGLRAAAESGLGSNGWALGDEKSERGNGMVVANPHFPWVGELKLWESHVTVPEVMDVYGATLLGVPGALIGFSEFVAWTHTFSVTGKRFIVYTLDLVPGEPTKYYYDGAVREMTPREFTIAVRQADGSIADVHQTLWFSHYGPMLNVNDFGWSDTLAVTYRDANLRKFGLIEQWQRMNRAKSMAEFQAAYREVDGIPWVHTMAAERGGEVWYIDAATTPNLRPEALAGWQQALDEGELLPTLLHEQAGAIVLDGSSSVNEWIVDPSTGKATVPIDQVPQLAGRRDFVMNANDSYWMANPNAPLTGYAKVHGDEGDPLSPRSRMNLTMLTEVDAAGASGADGKFSLEEVKAAILGNRSMTGDLLQGALAQRCQGAAPVTLADKTYDLGPACAVIGAWDRHYNLESRGAVLFREFIGTFNVEYTTDKGPLFAVGFDPADPIHTPHTLTPAPMDGGSDTVLVKLASAVRNLEEAGMALDVPLGEVQFANRGGMRVPLHGGQGGDGVANAVFYGSLSTALEALPDRGEVINAVTDLATDGYQITYGSSFIMAVELTPEGPEGAAILTYGESDDEASPHHVDQLLKYSAKEWRPILFKEEAIAADPELRTYEVAGGDVVP